MTCISFFAVVSILLSTSMVVSAQAPQPDLADRMSDMFRKRQEREPVDSIPGKVLAEQPERSLDLLAPYERHDSARIRRVAYAHCFSLGVSTTDPEIRREVTLRLVHACADSDGLVWQHAAKWLRSFEEHDFMEDSKVLLHKLLMDDPPRRDIVLVVGVAEMREDLPRLKLLLVDEPVAWKSGPGSVSWSARLARARMGSQEDVRRAIELVKLEKDPIIRVGKLLRALAYTRQPVALEYIATFLDSDGRFPPLKKNDPGILYAQYAMDALARYVPSFPAKTDNIGVHTQADIIRAREWMKSRSSRE